MCEKYSGEQQSACFIAWIQAAMSDGTVKASPTSKALVEELYTWSQLPDLTEGHHGVGTPPAETHRYCAQVGKTGETAIPASIVSLVGGTKDAGRAVSTLGFTNHILKHRLNKA